jgi:hypothetical protein
MSRETPEQENILNRAAVRWHSDDPIVCLQRALVEVEQLEQRERTREQPPIERVIAGLANLGRIADTLERLAGEMTAPPFPTGTRGELMGALVGAAIGSGLELEQRDDDDDDEPSSEGH